MRLIFANRFYWPETPATGQLLTDLAEGLAGRGHAVIVLTSTGNDGGMPLPAAENRNGVSIVRLRGTRWHKLGLLGKACDYASFYTAVLWRAWREVRTGDTLVALTDPPLLGIGLAAVARVRGAALVHWAQDIYPEIAIQLAGLKPLALLRPLRDTSWRRARTVVTLGDDMAATVRRAGVPADRVAVIPNWAPVGLAPVPSEERDAQRRAWGLEGKFVVAYSGNLGRVHDLDPVVEAATRLRDRPDIVFLFVGGGARLAELQAAVRSRKLTNVSFQPAQPRACLARSLASGDLHLVTLLPGCERYVFPSKLYGPLAVGRPVLAVASPDSELARLVTDAGIGVATDGRDSAGLAATIGALADAPARVAALAQAALDYAANRGGLELALARWARVLGYAPATRPATPAPPAAFSR